MSPGLLIRRCAATALVLGGALATGWPVHLHAQGHGPGGGHGPGRGHGHHDAGDPGQSALEAPVPEEFTAGAQVFESICSQCHSLSPPAKLAPPMRHVARHLRMRFETEEAATRHILTFLPAPDSTSSIMPPMARQRFGLMPPQPLPKPYLEAVARYVWYLGESR